MHNDFTAKANAYLGKMKTYLKATASATVFNPFYTSELYSRETARAQPFKNKPENKIVVI